MTALPLQQPRLLTVAEFAALGETAEGRYELHEGTIVMAAFSAPATSFLPSRSRRPVRNGPTT
ncbi:hypothetical protein [Pseudonocardia sp. GCM10023141]|uniref:hypothetical protein n=1 Tax=Pseudonocardia sp. GCM10023141 TaxID=3252653 RepID=UPI0036208BDA